MDLYTSSQQVSNEDDAPSTTVSELSTLCFTGDGGPPVNPFDGETASEFIITDLDAREV